MISDIFLIPGIKKYPLLMFKGYTYNRYHISGGGKIYWQCSRIKSGCKAAMRTYSVDYKQFDILREDHNHDPPSYHRTADGEWVKV